MCKDLANPLFSCTGMKFWLYMVTVVLSLPKTIVFVVLGTPTAKNSKGAKWAKVVAIGVVVVITSKSAQSCSAASGFADWTLFKSSPASGFVRRWRLLRKRLKQSEASRKPMRNKAMKSSGC